MPAAGQADGLGRFGRGVLQRLGEQPAEHPGGMQGQGQGAGIRPQPGGQHHQRRPHQFRNRAQGIEHEARQRASDGTEAPGGRQCQGEAEQRGEQGAQRRHGQGFQAGAADLGEVRGGKVRREEAGGVVGHQRQPPDAGQPGEVQAEPGEGDGHGEQDRQQQGVVERALHGRRLLMSAGCAASG
ncbi:hypothetical protein D3C80_1439770 [compost metagenome]